MTRAPVRRRTLQSALKLVSQGHAARYLAQPPSLSPPCARRTWSTVSEAQRLSSGSAALICVFSMKSPQNSWGIAARASVGVCQLKWTQGRKNKTPGHEVHQQPFHQKSIRKWLFTETQYQGEYSMLVLLRLFQTFFSFFFFLHFCTLL